MKNTIFVLSMILLLSNCSKKEEPAEVLMPESDFSFTFNKLNYKKIQFQNSSHKLITNSKYFWTFGDSATSTQENPIHIYQYDGLYSVSLKVTNKNISDVFSKEIYITSNSKDTTKNEDSLKIIKPTNNTPTILFTYSQKGRNVQLVNASTGLTNDVSFVWNFGDGGTANTENTTHDYQADGFYSVVLKVVSDNKNYSFFKTIYVSSSLIPQYDTIRPIPSFTYSYIENKVLFINSSSLITKACKYKWNFGDGSAETTEENPSHIYTNGTYSVVLKVSNAEYTVSYSAEVVVPYINVLIKQPEAFFVFSQKNDSVHFQNASSITNDKTTYFWTFGDGFFSNEENPFHIYAEPGKYSVVLNVRNVNTSDSYAFPITIP